MTYTVFDLIKACLILWSKSYYLKIPVVYLNLLLNNSLGIEALTKKIITSADLKEVKSLSALTPLVSPNGIKALQNNLFKVDTFCKIASRELREIILSDNCISMLLSGELDFDAAIALGEIRLKLLSSVAGRTAFTLKPPIPTPLQPISEAKEAFFQPKPPGVHHEAIAHSARMTSL